MLVAPSACNAEKVYDIEVHHCNHERKKNFSFRNSFSCLLLIWFGGALFLMSASVHIGCVVPYFVKKNLKFSIHLNYYIHFK